MLLKVQEKEQKSFRILWIDEKVTLLLESMSFLEANIFMVDNNGIFLIIFIKL
jgi:hypothetical protein